MKSSLILPRSQNRLVQFMSASIFRQRFIALGFAVLLSALPACAQKKSPVPSKKEAKALLERAAELTNLRTSNASAFHLRAKTRSFGYQITKGRVAEFPAMTFDGAYELWWASPDRWREEVTWSGKTSTRVADGGQLWTQGDDGNRFKTTSLIQALDYWRNVRELVGGDLGRVQRKEKDGVSATCMHFPLQVSIEEDPVYGREKPKEWSTCLDAKDNLPLWIDFDRYFDIRRLEFGKYLQMGDKRFPSSVRQLVQRSVQDRLGAPVGAWRPLMAIEVELLEAFDISQADVFAPAASASSNPWCSNMVPPKGLKFRSGWVFRPLEELVFLRVDERGRVVDVHAFTPDSELALTDSAKQEFRKAVFEPATCQGIPVEAEFMMYVYDPVFGSLHYILSPAS